MNFIYRIFILILLLALLGCGAGSTDKREVLTGVFIDSPVMGLAYKTLSFDSLTNADGEFQYYPGEVIEFSIGAISLGKTAAKAKITPFDLVGASNKYSVSKGINRLRLLQSLDADLDPANGIRILVEAHAKAPVLSSEDALWDGLSEAGDITFDQWMVDNYLSTLTGSPELVTESQAMFHFQSENGGAPNGTRYKLGGSVFALDGQLAISNQGLEEIVLTGTGGNQGKDFRFSTPYISGSPYLLEIVQQPDGQICEVSNGDGMIGSSHVDGVSIYCHSINDIVVINASGLNQSLIIKDSSAQSISFSVAKNAEAQIINAPAIGDITGPLTVQNQPLAQICTAVVATEKTPAGATIVQVDCQNKQYYVDIALDLDADGLSYFGEMGSTFVTLSGAGTTESHVFKSNDNNGQKFEYSQAYLYGDTVKLSTDSTPAGLTCSLDSTTFNAQNPIPPVAEQNVILDQPGAGLKVVVSKVLYCRTNYYSFEISGGALAADGEVTIQYTRGQNAPQSGIVTGQTPFRLTDIRASESVNAMVSEGLSGNQLCYLENDIVSRTPEQDLAVSLQCVNVNTFVFQFSNRAGGDVNLDTTNAGLEISVTDNTAANQPTNVYLFDSGVLVPNFQLTNMLVNKTHDYEISITSQADNFYCSLAADAVLLKRTIASGELQDGQNSIGISCFSATLIENTNLDSELISSCAINSPKYLFQVTELKNSLIPEGNQGCPVTASMHFQDFSLLDNLTTINLLPQANSDAASSLLDVRQLASLAKLNFVTVNSSTYTGPLIDSLTTNQVSQALLDCVSSSNTRSGANWQYVSDVNVLDCSGTNTSDLTGLWIFRNLEVLRLNNSNVVSTSGIMTHQIRADIPSAQPALHSSLVDLDIGNNVLDDNIANNVSELHALLRLNYLDLGHECSTFGCRPLFDLDSFAALSNLTHIGIRGVRVTTPTLLPWVNGNQIHMPLVKMDDVQSNTNIGNENPLSTLPISILRGETNTSESVVVNDPDLDPDNGYAEMTVSTIADTPADYVFHSQHRIEVDLSITGASSSGKNIAIYLKDTVPGSTQSRLLYSNASLANGNITFIFPEQCVTMTEAANEACLAGLYGKVIQPANQDFGIRVEVTGSTTGVDIDAVRIRH